MKARIIWSDIDADSGEIDAVVDANEGSPNYFRISSTDPSDAGKDLMRLALSDRRARKWVDRLAARGYYAYFNEGNETRFVRHDRVKHHWPAVKNGSYCVTGDDIVYSLTMPERGAATSLVVVFSPLSSTPRFSRYFGQAFKTLQKFLPPGSAILRIADLGGAKGAFYLGTRHVPDNATRIASLVSSTVEEHGIDRERVVLYGASKGGTGALFHGLQGGWKFVAVDPILSDDWYEQHKKDYHFTAGEVFLHKKQDVIRDTITSSILEGMYPQWGSVVVSSQRSPQWPTILTQLANATSSISLLVSENQAIKKHPDVAPQTIYAQVMSINSLLLGLGSPSGVRSIP